MRGGDGQSFKVVGVFTDRDGSSHTRMTRAYNGLPVLGGDIVVHQTPAGKWRGSSLTLAKAPTAASPQVSAKTAKKRAVTKNRKADGSPALVVEARTADHAPRLAWRVLTVGKQADGTPSRVYTSVDAATGKVLLREETIHTEAGDGKSLYTGTVPLETTASGGAFQLKDPSRGNTYTGDAENETDLCILIWCLRRAPRHAVHRRRQPLGQRHHVRPRHRRRGRPVRHRRDLGLLQERLRPRRHRRRRQGIVQPRPLRRRLRQRLLGRLVLLHDLRRRRRQPARPAHVPRRRRARDEPRRHQLHRQPHLQRGVRRAERGDVRHHGGGRRVLRQQLQRRRRLPGRRGGRSARPRPPALRFMDKPSKDGDSADSWSSNTKNLDVHYSSGVGNHFFYLLSEGSGAKTINGVSYNSPTSNGSTVTGIGRDAAVKIWYRALTTYMTSSTDYKGARTATLNAAKDLFGEGSTQHAAVAAAWSAVNVA
nr:M4 family metallopeptidase [Actinomadura madurae]